jgi:hypothetical protein
MKKSRSPKHRFSLWQGGGVVDIFSVKIVVDYNKNQMKELLK